MKDQLVRLSKTERLGHWQVSDGLNYEGDGEREDNSLQNKMSNKEVHDSITCRDEIKC